MVQIHARWHDVDGFFEFLPRQLLSLQSQHGFLQILTVWLPGHVGSAHFIHVRRFLAFFAGRRSAKESATHFRTSFSMVSRVVTLSELGLEFRGWGLSWVTWITGDEVEDNSVLVSCWLCWWTAWQVLPECDGSCSKSINPFSTMCGIVDWKGIGGATKNAMGHG